MRKIAFTFAGRKERMRNQLVFMRTALDRGIVDEWHLWNFARNAQDDAWLRGAFEEAASLVTDEKSIVYQPFVANVGSAAFYVYARSDAHFLIRLDSGEVLEVVLGAFENTRSLLRVFGDNGYRLHAPARNVSGRTLDPARENLVNVTLGGSSLRIRLDGEPLFDFPTPATLIGRIEVHTGYGAWGEWRQAREPGRIRLKNTALKHYEGFRLAYNYYSSARFADSAFVKLDDDIVYCDIEGFRSFVEELRNGTELVILSANVMNNGVCAYVQEKAGFFDKEAFGFEYPPAGIGGRLWESSRLCGRLHEYFLANKDRILGIASSSNVRVEIPIGDRFSINFVGFRYPLMLMMSSAFQYGHEDDEHVMTRIVTRMFGVRKYILFGFVVSHLSFFKQDETLNANSILTKYSELYA